MMLKHRLDHLALRLPPPRVIVTAGDALAKISAVLERYAPPIADAVFADGRERLNDVLDRLAANGWAIPARAGHSLAARTAAAFGMTTGEWREALQARARGERWCG